jgi:hypothetical protein
MKNSAAVKLGRAIIHFVASTISPHFGGDHWIGEEHPSHHHHQLLANFHLLAVAEEYL